MDTKQDIPRLSVDTSSRRQSHNYQTHESASSILRSPVASSFASHRRSSSISGLPLAAGYAPSIAGSSSVAGSMSYNQTSPMQPWQGVPVGMNTLAADQHRLGVNSIADIVDGHIASSPAHLLGNLNNANNSNMPQRTPNSRYSLSAATSPFFGLSSSQISQQSSSLSSLSAQAAAANFKPPTAKDIPPVTLTQIPKVSRAELRAYLKEISSEYDQFYESRLGSEFPTLNAPKAPLSRKGSYSALSVATASEAGTTTGRRRSSAGEANTTGRRRRSSATQSLQTSVSVLSNAFDSLGITTAVPKAESNETGGYLGTNFDSVSQQDLGSQEESSSPKITPLSTIPAVFFEADFQLDNPRTFDIVSEKSSIIQTLDDGDSNKENNGSVVRKGLANNSILQEKLSWYIDTVELHLIHEISTASHSFFSALDNLQHINLQAKKCLASIQQLRQDLKKIDESRLQLATKSLKLRQRRKNVDKLLQALLQIQVILENSDKAEAFLLKENELDKCLQYLDALDEIIAGKGQPKITKKQIKDEEDGDDDDDEYNELVKEWTEGWKYPICDVRSVKGLEELRESLVVLRTQAGNSFAKTFTTVLCNDLKSHYEGVIPQDTLNRLGKVLKKPVKPKVAMGIDDMDSESVPMSQSASNTSDASLGSHPINNSYLDISPELREKLEETIMGLVRSNNVQGALKQYSEAVIKDAKSLVRRYLPSTSSSASQKDDDAVSISSNMTGMTGMATSEKSTSLAVLLRAMTPKQFEEMITNLYTKLSEFFRRLATHQKLLLDISVTLITKEEQQQKNKKKSSTAASTPVIDISELLKNSIDSSLSRLVKVFNVRREQNSTMDIQSIVNFYSLSFMFLYECEAICGLDIDGSLGNTITNQLKMYITNMHRIKINTMMNLLEKDQWKEEEITNEFQDLVDQMVLAGHSDPYQWIESSRQVLNESSLDATKSESTESKEPTNGDEAKKKKNKKLYIGNGVFIIPRCAIQSVSMLEEYMRLTVLFPPSPHLTGEILNNSCEFLNKFNTRSEQLIISAGATKIEGGLKHITAKTLALCAQALNVMITLVPYIKECGKRHYLGDNNNNGEDDEGKFQVVSEEFEKVIKNLKTHQDSIYAKFVTLMSDKMNMHGSAMRKIVWDEQPDDLQPNKYMQSLVKDTTVLAKILANYLPKNPYLMVISQVFDIYKRRLLEEYQTNCAIPYNTNGKSSFIFKKQIIKDNVLRDARYFEEKLASIEGSGNTGQILVETLNAYGLLEDTKKSNNNNTNKNSLEKEDAAKGEALFDAGDFEDEDEEVPPPAAPEISEKEDSSHEEEKSTSKESSPDISNEKSSVDEILDEESKNKEKEENNNNDDEKSKDEKDDGSN